MQVVKLRCNKQVHGNSFPSCGQSHVSSLVTGGTGFLGSRLALRLIADGEPVSVIGRNKEKGQALAPWGPAFLEVDIQNSERVKQVIEGHDILFHVAALSSPWGRYEDFYKNNVVGTRNVIEGCLEHNVKRLVYVSTPSVYANGYDRFNVHETSPLPKRPINHYAETKLLADREIEQAFKQYGLPVVSIRPRAIYGPGDNAILPRLIRALESKRLPVIGSGQTLTQLTYVDDVVSALILCARVPDEHLGKVYNIAGSETVKLWDVITYLAKALNLPQPKGKISTSLALMLAGVMKTIYERFLPNREPLLTRYSVTVLAHSMTLDTSAAERDLGYVPQVSVEEGLERFITWWKEEYSHD
jgi:nucleoside-diphosphate-sugar epimerase